jgi:hypothetical protein
VTDLYDTDDLVVTVHRIDGTNLDIPLAVYVDIEDLAQRLVEGAAGLVVARDGR